MDGVRIINIRLHPVTKVLAASSIALAIITQMGFLSIPRVVFLPSKIILEPWRLYTSYCYFGNLDFGLIQRIFTMSQTNESLERAYLVKMHTLPLRWYKGLDESSLRQKFEENRAWDFAYFLFRMSFSIVACVTLLNQWYDVAKYYLILGPTMNGVLLYILCRNMPEDIFYFLGIQVKAKYAPFIETIVSMVLSYDFQTLISARKDFLQAIIVFLGSRFVISTLFEYVVGHLWWFVEFVYLNRTTSQALWDKSVTEIVPGLIFGDFELVNILRWLITPPWYFWITKKMRAEQANLRT